MRDQVERALRRVESALLAGLLIAMIGVAAFQVAARNLFGFGLSWGDGMVRVALLWLTMIGAMAAAGAHRHIRIDAAARFADARTARRLDRITSLFAVAVCFALAWFSIEFIVWDYRDAVPGFGAVPAWVCELVIPVGAAVTGLRYLVQALDAEPAPPADAAPPEEAPPAEGAAPDGTNAERDDPGSDDPDAALPAEPAPPLEAAPPDGRRPGRRGP